MDMDKILKKIIAGLYYGLFLFIPLVLFHKTSEIFEFNKMVFTYLSVILISGVWATRIIFQKKLIFKRTLLDIPLLIFIFSQLLSTVFSIDQRTSLLGYYSRFHGGFLSTLTYSLLYWAYVSNMNKADVYKSVKFLFASTLVTSIWGIFEHLGHSFSCYIFPEFHTFDVSCWVQDVKTRVFASFGQPNWLAAWLAAIIPLTWVSGMINRNKEVYKSFITKILGIIFLLTMLYTKSRSGILGFAVSFLIFWGVTILKSGKQIKKSIADFSITAMSVIFIVLVTGSPWTPPLTDFLSQQESEITQPAVSGPALEVGSGTESGEIRRIVWKGAIDIWKNYPVFGSGVETFAFSYYQFRPEDHNQVSEWDYLYNKAHNEYLNFAATTGTIGISAYLFLILSVIYLFIKQLKHINAETGSGNKNADSIKNAPTELSLTNLALLSGYAGILITNFFGFSTVAVSLLFFLFPALSISLADNEEGPELKREADSSQKTAAAIVFVVSCYLLLLVLRYWKTDLMYATGRNMNLSGNYDSARTILTDVVKRSPEEAIYWDELADATFSIATSLAKENNMELAGQAAKSAVTESSRAVSLSPANVNLKRKMGTRLNGLAIFDPAYNKLSVKILEEAVKQAPTDPKLFYNLSYSSLQSGDYNNAIKAMQKTVSLKPDYEKARFALALMYIDTGENDKAKVELQIILKNNPGHQDAKKELEELMKK